MEFHWEVTSSRWPPWTKYMGSSQVPKSLLFLEAKLATWVWGGHVNGLCFFKLRIWIVAPAMVNCMSTRLAHGVPRHKYYFSVCLWGCFYQPAVCSQGFRIQTQRRKFFWLWKQHLSGRGKETPDRRGRMKLRIYYIRKFNSIRFQSTLHWFAVHVDYSLKTFLIFILDFCPCVCPLGYWYSFIHSFIHSSIHLFTHSVRIYEAPDPVSPWGPQWYIVPTFAALMLWIQTVTQCHESTVFLNTCLKRVHMQQTNFLRSL